jgi:DNA-binding transcriptional LysR family regulator
VDFRQLRYFRAAVEQRSMTGAARACAAGQPTLSTQIKRLEQELGAPLFVRTPSGIEPTQAGRTLHRAVAPTLQSAAHGVRYLKSGVHAPIEAVTLRIDYSAASLLGALVQATARDVEARSPQFNFLLEASEWPAVGGLGVSPSTGGIHIRHTVAAKGTVADKWLLVAAGSGRQPPSRRLADGCVIDVPALPDDVAQALARRPAMLASASLRMHGVGVPDLLLALLSEHRGIALLPRLAMNVALLRHPRLATEEISAGLPPLMVTVDAAGASPGMRRVFIERFGECAKRPRATPDPGHGQLPDVRQLQYFLAACDEGAMTRTAAKFNIVQPALSAQVKSLETKLGRKLFERLPHGIAPTAFGRTTYAIYAPILAQLRSLRRKETPESNGQTFCIGVLPALDEQSLLLRAVTAAILEWQQIFPKVTLRSSEALSDTLLDWVADGSVDLAIVDDLHARTAFVSNSLSLEPLAILTSARNADCPNGPIKLADVARLDLVLPSPRHGLRALMNRHFASIGISLTPKLELDSMASAVSLVKGGGWATILPASAVQRSIDDRLLAAHPIVQPTIMRDLRAVQLPRHRAKPWEHRFAAMVRAHLRRSPSGNPIGPSSIAL